MFQPSGRFVLCAVVASALSIPGAVLLGQTADQPSAAPSIDAEKRLQWLNSRVPPKVAVAPKVAASPKVGFRSNPKVIGTRPVEIPSAESRPAPSPPAEIRSAESLPAKPNPAELSPSKTRSAESRPAKATPAPLDKLPPPTVVAEPPPTKTRTAESRPAKATPAPLAKLTPPTVVREPSPTKVRSVEARSTPVPKPTLAPAVAAIPSTNSPSTKPQLPASAPNAVKGRYPWKTGIVTTVFWIGEPPGGNNFTPNRSSSWDAHWTQSYGGFDNPDPTARRNFIPVKFTPRQNPFYVALPYNDVTRGTTKPEARRVIPWFKDAFRKEGQSVCRDRWVAIRNRAGKIAYAQWSDCGPFRTDHWQYVFGSERPKPNLNQGAGLDVSPALRDYLGLDGTDLTDWKFVDFKDIPIGPWALHGQNNTFALKGVRSPKGTAKASGRTAENSAQIRVREL